jgi:hypothetical protein
MQTRASLRVIRFLLLFLVGSVCLCAQSAPRPSRIAPDADLSSTVRLPGHVPAWATSSNRVSTTASSRSSQPAGTAASDTLRVTFLLSRTPAMQLAFQRLLEEQQSPSSPQYRHWLTPAEIGTKYGPVADEIDAISAWVRSQGLQVAAVSPARTTMIVAGPASAVASALQVTLGTYQVGGKARMAPMNDPAIPRAFAAVISKIAGLTEIGLDPSASMGAVQAIDGAAGQARSTGAHPLYTDPNTGVHSIAPGDFATIYDVASTTGAGDDGTGVRVAVLGQSDIVNSDITDLQSVMGLAQKAPNQMVVPGTTDPGLVLKDQRQSTFEVGRVTTTAPGATVDLLIAGAADGGIATALQYNVDELLDPVMSISYSECEPSVSGAEVALYDSYFAQAAAEGISTFVTAGSSGAAGCAASFKAPPQTPPAKAMGNFLCSSSYVTCVGATEFNDTATGSLYWSGTNGSNQSSAVGYIPEGAWNEPVNPATGDYQIAGTGSGASAYIAKPTWQTGAGVPNDNVRDIPDVAFSGSEHDGYFGCLAAVGADCSQFEKTTFYGGPAGPASMAGVAAILGQKLARTSETGNPLAGLGNINPMLYLLASTTPTAFHDVTPISSGGDCTVMTPNLCNNSTPGPAGPTGGVPGDMLQVGYDLLTGLGSLDVGNFVNAAALLPAPVLTTLSVTAPQSAAVGQSVPLSAVLTFSGSGSPTGTIYIYFNGQPVANGVIQGNGVSGLQSSFDGPGTYTVTAAYPGDLNFAGSVASTQVVVSAGTVVGMVVTASPTSITAGQSAVFTATLPGNPAPSGTVTFFSNGAAISGAVPVSSGVATTGSVSFPTAATYQITAVYSGDTNYLSTTSPSLPFVVNAPAPGNVQGFSLRATPSTVVAGQTAVFTATLTGTPTPSGTVTFFSNGTAISGAVGLVGGVASTPAVNFPTAGTFPITAVYSGDANYVKATSTSLPFVVTAPALIGVQNFSVSANPGTISTGQSAVFTATLAGTPVPTGNVQFFSNGTAISGSVAIVNGVAATPSISFATAGTYAITATYGGDGTYASAPSSPLSFVVTNPVVVLPGIQLTASPSSISLSPGATSGNSSTVTVRVVGGLSGAVAITCAVTPVSGAAANAPTCNVTPSQLTLADGGSATSVVSCGTTLPQAVGAAGQMASNSSGTMGIPTSRISLALLLALLIPVSRRRALRARLGRLSALVPLACLLLGSAALSGCGGTVGAVLSSTGTTAGLYNVTVTATGSQVSASTVLSLTVR